MTTYSDSSADTVRHIVAAMTPTDGAAVSDMSQQFHLRLHIPLAVVSNEDDRYMAAVFRTLEFHGRSLACFGQEECRCSNPTRDSENRSTETTMEGCSGGETVWQQFAIGQTARRPAQTVHYRGSDIGREQRHGWTGARGAPSH